MPIKDICEQMTRDFSPENLIRFLREKGFKTQQNYTLSPLKLTASQKLDNRLNDLYGRFSEPSIAAHASLDDGTSFPVFFISLKEGNLTERSSRKLQFDYAKQMLLFISTNYDIYSLPAPCSHGIFVFADNHKYVRMSLIEDYGREDSPKRYRRHTFYVEPMATNRTFIDRMCMDWSSFDKIKDAFSVERLSDEFFDKYKEHYSDFIAYATGKRMKEVKKNKWIEVDDWKGEKRKDEIMSQFAKFDNAEKAFRDYIKKMMGRLVFLQFLQKKGWLGVPVGQAWGNGDKNYLQKLFKNKSESEQKDFLDSVLKILFFDTLNTDRNQNGDVAEDVLSIEPGKKIRIPYLNGGLFEQDATDNAKVKFPPKYFEDLLDTFDRFNFTIDENDPDDAEIGVDPEMLGRIFENLLEDNKDKGAFYTPKEIVSYMCQESLIQYLGDTDVNRKLVEELDADSIPSEQKKNLVDKMKSVKICDPAIGSGAFPMGMLNLLYRLRIKLGDIEENAAGILHAKKEIIQNNIYGVDIESGAVDIARLRFWLSIVVDEDTPTPLPNFDYKIMQGNSLLEQYNGVDLKLDLRPADKKGKKTNATIVDKQLCFTWDNEEKALENLKLAMGEFFDPAKGENKNELRINIDLAVKNYIKTKCGNNPQINADVDKMDLNNKPFFLWHLYFADVFAQGGFDIVIGNPPYVDSETMTRIDEEKETNYRQMYHKLYSTCKGNWDLFIAFIELGIILGHEKSSLSFIVPNKLIAAKYANYARNFLSKNHLLEIRDYSSVEVFSGIGVYPCTFITKKNSLSKVTKMTKMKNREQVQFFSNVLYSKFVSDSLWDKYFYSKSVVDLIIKISSFSKLSSQFHRIMGAATVNEAYKIREIVENLSDTNNTQYSKLVNTGTIDKYAILWGKQPIHYLGFTAINPIVEDCDLQRVSPKRYAQAKASKVIIAGLSIELEAYYDNGSCLAGKSTTIILENSHGKNGIKALVSLLNSKLISFWLRKNYNSLAMSGGYLNIGVNEVSNIPLPILSNQTIESLAILCDQSQIGKTEAIEKINDIVYKIYNLTKSEIAIICENSQTISDGSSSHVINEFNNSSIQTDEDDARK